MPGVGVAPNAGASPDAQQGTVPFLYGSNFYREKIFTDQFQLTAGTSQEFVHSINPGGYLRGVRLIVTSAGGALGAGVLANDAPYSMFSSISLENIDGSPICYPMPGFSYYLISKFFYPWLYDPSKRQIFNNSANPSFELFIKPEIRHSAGALANTDARALYRIRYTFAPGLGLNGTSLFTTAPTTYPLVMVTGFMEAWSQPDSTDLHGNPIDPVAPGLSIAHLLRQQVVPLNAAGANNLIQLANTGNEMRGILVVVRDSTSTRQDYLSDPIRWRLDQRSLHVSSPQETFEHMNDYYDFLTVGTSVRDTGTYMWPRFVYEDFGEYWLATTNATFLVLESSTPANAVNLPGTIQIITSEVVPVGPVPAEFEGI